MKLYCKQVPEENQMAEIDWDEDLYERGIVFDGNLEMRRRSFRCYDLWKIHGETMLYDLAMEPENALIILTDIEKNVGDWTRKEVEAWIELAKKCVSKGQVRITDEDTCTALSLIMDEVYTTSVISGFCQGEWQRVFHPISVTKEEIEDLGSRYFNTGTEWIISESYDGDPAKIEGEDIYVPERFWNPDKIRAYIAESYGVKEEEVNMFQFTGYIRIPKYKAM